MRPWLTFLLVAAASGCVARGSDDVDATGDAVTAQPRELSAMEAELLFREVLEDVRTAYVAKYPGRLGQGWTGNASGSGDKCNVVHDRFQAMIEKRFMQVIRERNVVVKTHDLTTRVAAGKLFVEALSGHVYIVLVDVRGKTPKDVLVFDPWRSEAAFFATDPNWGGKDDVRWLLDRMRP